MTLAEQMALIRRTLRRPASGQGDGWRVVTIGPGEEEWAVVDRDGHTAFVGPVVFAARFAADLAR